MSMEIVLASQNAKKARELGKLFEPLGWQLRPLSEFTGESAPEDAPSFVENAIAKARFAAEVSGLPAIADDSGLEVAALNGEPGVYSARYAGEHGDDAANNAQLLAALEDVPEEDRDARFVCVLALLTHAEDPTPLIAEGYWYGRILEAPRGEQGFGYDPLFWVPDHQCSSAELAPETKNRISHRGQAMQSLLDRLQALNS